MAVPLAAFAGALGAIALVYRLSVVAGRRVRAALYIVLTAGSLFPLGFLVYGAGVLELGREAGIELADRWVLMPLASAAIAGLTALAVCLAARARAASRPSPP